MVQAPHCAMPQPNLVPVSPSDSRSTHSSGVSRLTSAEQSLPLTFSLIMVVVSEGSWPRLDAREALGQNLTPASQGLTHCLSFLDAVLSSATDPRGVWSRQDFLRDRLPQLRLDYGRDSPHNQPRVRNEVACFCPHPSSPPRSKLHGPTHAGRFRRRPAQGRPRRRAQARLPRRQPTS